MVSTRILEEDEYYNAVELLSKDELVVLPTETVYGLAGNAFSDIACRKIFSTKGRAEDNPLIVHCSDMEMIASCMKDIANTNAKKSLLILEKCAPGPVTVIVKSKNCISPVARAGGSSVALRIPSHKLCRTIIKECGFPLAAPSANNSGRPSPTDALMAWEEMYGKVPAIVDGGVCQLGLESTIVKVHNQKIEVLREGSVSIQAIEESSNIKIHHKNTRDKGMVETITPGDKYTHYSPDCEVCVYESSSENKVYIKNLLSISNRIQKDIKKLGVIKISHINYFYDGIVGEDIIFERTVQNWEELATRVYEMLAESDRLNLDVIFFPIPEKKSYPALYDRLWRASASL